MHVLNPPEPRSLLSFSSLRSGAGGRNNGVAGGEPNGGTESIYTILIRFPPKQSSSNKSNSSSSSEKQTTTTSGETTATCSSSAAANGGRSGKADPILAKANTLPHGASAAAAAAAANGKQTVCRVPSITMLPEDGGDGNGNGSGRGRHYPRSLPIVRRFDSPEKMTSARQAAAAGSPALSKRALMHSASVSATHSHAHTQLPLDTKLVPRQLLRSSTTGGAGESCGSGASATPASHASLLSVASTGGGAGAASSSRRAAGGGIAGVAAVGGKVKKASSEKKQDRKAAKTLSAILLAFIVTWTPYSVLVVINAILGKQSAEDHIPPVLWQFCYYLCYINSTINPVLYALCNAAFRRTYVRILTCRWGSRARQPLHRFHYG